MTCSICHDPQCVTDPDGWCHAHEWDCGEYHLYLAEEGRS